QTDITPGNISSSEVSRWIEFLRISESIGMEI
ncbi:unnamed protein product, partial [Rotaria sp. Silwood2]